MSVSIGSFQAAARLGGIVNVKGQGAGATLVNSQKSWLGRAVGWLKTAIEGKSARQAEANQRTRETFVEMLRTNYGNHIADTINSKFSIESSSGKPLSARTVRGALKDAAASQASIRSSNAGWKALYSDVESPSMGRILTAIEMKRSGTELPASAHEARPRMLAPSETQAKLIPLLVSEAIDKASQNDSRVLDMDEVKATTMAAVEKALDLGPMQCGAILDARAAFTANVREIGQALAQFRGASGPESDPDLQAMRDSAVTASVAKFAGILAETDRATETIARLAGAGDGADGALDLLTPLVQTALKDMPRAERAALRDNLMKPDGLAFNFVRGAMTAMVSDVPREQAGAHQAMTANATMASHTLKAMLSAVGTTADRVVLEGAEDLPPPGSGVSLGDRFANEISYMFSPKAYDLGALDAAHVLSANRNQMQDDFLHFTDTRNHSPEYRKFVEIAARFSTEPSPDGEERQPPTLDDLRELDGMIDTLNLDGGTRSTFKSELERLGEGKLPATPENLRNVLAPVSRSMANDMATLFPSFKNDAAANTLHRATLG